MIDDVRHNGFELHRNRGMTMKLFPLVTILLLGCSGFALAGWEFETVDGTVGTGQYSSLALDSNGYPHIVYQYFTPAMSRELFYTHWNGSYWEFDVIDGDGPDENTGAFCSIALDSNDTPHVSYYDLELKALKYAKLNGSSWDIEVVEIDEMHTYVGSKKTIVGSGLLLIEMEKNSSTAYWVPGEPKQGKSSGIPSRTKK